MCNLCGLANSIGGILYVSERIASCCAATAVVICLVLTMITMLAIGVGLGYNYCVVDHMLGAPLPLDSETQTEQQHIRRMLNREFKDESEIPVDTSVERKRRHAKRSIGQTSEKNTFVFLKPNRIEPATTISSEYLEIKPTMIVPLRKYNLLSLMARLRIYNMNVTLELIQ